MKDKEIDLDEALIKAKESSLEKDKHFQEIANKSTELQELIEHSEQRSTIAEQLVRINDLSFFFNCIMF